MKRPEPDSPEADERCNAAAAWLVRNDRGLTAAEQDEFLDWLAADPRHAEWFEVHRGFFGSFVTMAQWRPEHSEEPNPDLLSGLPRRKRGRRLGWAMATAAAVVVSASLAWLMRPMTEPEPFDGPALLERRILADGSTIDLDRDAVVHVDYSTVDRRVVLTSGEALFTVVKDALRPFIVEADGIDVRAVGTAFAVRLAPDRVEVLVTSGTVEVQAPPADEMAPDDPSLPEPPRVVAGQRATIPTDRAAPIDVVDVSPEETERLASWQPQLLDFSSAPLSRAVAEFNRRNRVQLVLDDPTLADLPIIASIRSDKVEGFANFLRTTAQIEVEHREDRILLRRKR